MPRDDFAASVRLGDQKWNRIVLVTGAGVGKTTNMQYLQSQLAARDSKRLPMLLQLDREVDLEDKLAREKSKGALLDSLVDDMTRDEAEKCRLRSRLLQMRAAGRITLLIDGLDHAWSRGRIGERIGALLSHDWRACPVVLSGRPWAFRELWPLVQADEWRFVRVNELREPEIRYFLSYRLDGPDAPPETRRDWLGALADEARNLLATPRLLFLISEIFHGTAEAARRTGKDPLEAVKALKLRTLADAYHRAYFEPGEVILAESQTPDDHDRINRRGLIAQGLDVSMTIPGVGRKHLGLEINVPPTEDNRAEQLRFAAGLLGAVAFEMYANADEYRSKSEQSSPEPFVTRLPEAKVSLLRDATLRRLIDAGLGIGASLHNDFTLLGKMNNGTVDFLLFQEMGAEKGIVWHDRTVQAFFAAHFLTNHGTDTDRKIAVGWIVGHEGKSLSAYDEFWQFAAEMPEVDGERWRKIVARCYRSGDEIRGSAPHAGAKHAWLQWHRRMIVYSLAGMSERHNEVVAAWRRSFESLKESQDPEQQRIHQEMVGKVNGESMFRDIAGGDCQYGADPNANPPVPGIQRPVAGFRLHQWAVTNEMYEQFDPDHREERWTGKHPLASEPMKNRGKKKAREPNQEDRCPVVNVTWYDAWCFSAWCGCRLPTELEWEHACRCGEATAFTFGEGHDGRKCEAEYCNSDCESTITVDGLPPNRWGLYQMHGNVWEWCDRLYESGASRRVRRGGSWLGYAGNCRSAYRRGDEPDYSNVDTGFRLAAVPALEPGQVSKSRA